MIITIITPNSCSALCSACSYLSVKWLQASGASLDRLSWHFSLSGLRSVGACSPEPPAVVWKALRSWRKHVTKCLSIRLWTQQETGLSRTAPCTFPGVAPPVIFWSTPLAVDGSLVTGGSAAVLLSCDWTEKGRWGQSLPDRNSAT